MKTKTLNDLFVEELKDLYDAEKQLVKALPKLSKAATSSELRDAFEHHLEETKGHVTRLEAVFEDLDVPARGKTCDGMKGLITEGQKILDEHEGGPVLDAALISAAQRVEHYEMAGYGTVRNFAEQLNHAKAAQLLQETLDEEKQADETLTEIAESGVNAEAMNGNGAPEDGPKRASRSKAKR